MLGLGAKLPLRSRSWASAHTDNTLGCHPNWPQEAPIAAPLKNLRLFYCALRSLAMFQGPLRQAGNLAAARCLHSVLEPLVSRPLRSARFLNRPHDLKFKGRQFLDFNISQVVN